VHEHFLLPRLLLSELVLLNEVAGNGTEIVRRDPVCGLVLDPGPPRRRSNTAASGTGSAPTTAGGGS
jgi:hypothetical protein